MDTITTYLLIYTIQKIGDNMENNYEIYCDLPSDTLDIKNKTFPFCPICHVVGDVGNYTIFREDIGLFCCSSCHRYIYTTMNINDFYLGNCSVTGFRVSAPFSLLVKKIYRNEAVLKSPQSYFDILELDFKNTIIGVPSTQNVDYMWTINLPIYIVEDEYEFILSPISCIDGNVYTVADLRMPYKPLNSYNRNIDLQYKDGRFILRKNTKMCEYCHKYEVDSERKEIGRLPDIRYGSNSFSRLSDAERTYSDALYMLGITNNNQILEKSSINGHFYMKIHKFTGNIPEHILYRYDRYGITRNYINNDLLDYVYLSSDYTPLKHIKDIEKLESNICKLCINSRDSSNRDKEIACRLCGVMFWSDKLSNRVCKSCQSTTHRYNFNVMSVFSAKRLSRLKKPHSIPMGVELEVLIKENVEIFKNRISECDSDFVFKWDGTIDMSSGVEIVTAPLKYEEHLLSKGWDIIFNEYTLCKSSKCGQHVHVPRSAIGSHVEPGHVQHVLYSESNRYFMERIAGRGSNNQYAPFDGRSYRRGRKYTGLNFTTKGNKTMEYRIFQSPTRFEVLLRNLQFVDSFTSFIRSFSTVTKGGRLSEYFYKPGFKELGYYSYVQDNNKYYPELSEVVSEFC